MKNMEKHMIDNREYISMNRLVARIQKKYGKTKIGITVSSIPLHLSQECQNKNEQPNFNETWTYNVRSMKQKKELKMYRKDA